MPTVVLVKLTVAGAVHAILLGDVKFTSGVFIACMYPVFTSVLLHPLLLVTIRVTL